MLPLHRLSPLISLLVALASSPTWASEDLSPGRLYNLAIQGDPNAQYSLGLAYYEGSNGLNRDLSKAESWLEQAHESGHELALAKLEEIRQAPKSASQAPAQDRAEEINLLCKGYKKGYSGEFTEPWSNQVRIDLAKEELLDYTSNWTIPNAINIFTLIKVHSGTLVIIDNGTFNFNDVLELRTWEVTINRYDGSVTGVLETDSGRSVMLHGQCKKVSERAF